MEPEIIEEGSDYQSTIRHRNRTENDNDQLLRSIKFEIPSFEGSLNPKEYLEWEAAIDKYFQWFRLTEDRKVLFAKMKLSKQARLYMEAVDNDNFQRNFTPIETWNELKRALKGRNMFQELIKINCWTNGNVTHKEENQ
ncbi:hypothetical protein HPP92_004347 [Vanilla planifolia]|uniref:Retrotransposon gag domain-containing protein n=1 Tax=Vanilla planifolia TaxID=51239 RepID=A0A835RWL1_VANPL|nr:hypothetical protein HPP92_004347 [Vanilla planifolia]